MRCTVAMAIKDWLVINRRINYCLTWHYNQMHISFHCFRLYFALVWASLWSALLYYFTVYSEGLLCISAFVILVLCMSTLSLHMPSHGSPKQRLKDLWVAVLPVIPLPFVVFNNEKLSTSWLFFKLIPIHCMFIFV